MKFKENHKTALAKILSDLVQCDGIVNQGEIDFLHQVYQVLDITSATRKKAIQLTLADAVNTLKSLGNAEKYAVLHIIQQLSLSDGSADSDEQLFITAVALSIAIQAPETQGIKTQFVSIPNLNFDTDNAVLYVETEFDKTVNASIVRDYDDICTLLGSSHLAFFYLPKVLQGLESKRTTFHQALNYLEPTLSDEQLKLIEQKLDTIDSTFLSKELFINYLNTNGLKISKPAFFFKMGSQRTGGYADFLIIEIDGDPYETLKRVYELNDGILNLKPQAVKEKDRRMLKLLTREDKKEEKDALSYTGFHKMLIDTMLKSNGTQEVSRLYITRRGDLFLTDRNNTEVKMPALGKALYILYLFNEEGITLSSLSDYRSELYRIYRQISTYGDETLLLQAVDNLTDFVGNTLNATLSRIKKAFTDILGDEASRYLIQGEKGGRKTIHLERHLVVYEDRNAFS